MTGNVDERECPPEYSLQHSEWCLCLNAGSVTVRLFAPRQNAPRDVWTVY